MTPYLFWYSMAGLVVGTLFFVGGVLLIWQRRHSSTKWSLTLGHLKVEISSNTPGVILATLGLLVIYLTRLDV